MEKIEILIVDDHPPFQEGLARLLQEEMDFEVVAKSSDGEEAMRLAERLHPDVAIIDVAMPKISGIEVAREIKATCPSTAILMLSAYDYESYLLHSLQVGARGYLLKTSPLRELISAVRLVHSGQAVFTSKAASGFLNRLAIDNGKERSGGLHDRELQILRLVAQGKANKEIARELVISDRTVQTHLVAIFRKLGVGSRTEAVAHALREGWLTLDDLP